ncbi:hypothetical protein [Cellulomonas sp. NS3]|uniref:hypothetical protein n=1 Tax=Cellulomonas sp. NS3 TaxID=2973977 RepID=UPI002161A9E2|nr:hypothetical protein [Cellulomonas sp. NS3]
MTGASSADAAEDPPPTLCSEVPNAYFMEERLEGDLVVDVECYMFRGRVYGDVTVLPGASFSVGRGGIDGNVEVAGHLSLGDSGVSGDVVLTSRETASLEVWVGDGGGGTIDGDVTGEAAEVFLEAATVWGAYDVDVRDATRIRRSQLIGPAATSGGRLIVHTATFYGGLTSAGSGDVMICGATIAGDLRVSGLTDFASIGAEPRRDQRYCSVLVTGSLVLEDNQHSIDLGYVSVARDLVCTGNTGPRGITETNWFSVRGERTGQCAR